MLHNQTTLRQSPFVFLKRIAVVQFLLTYFLLLIVFVPDARGVYETSGADEVISYPIVVAVLVTLLQVGVIGGLFGTWFYPVYRITQQEVLWTSSPFRREEILLRMEDLLDGSTHSGWIGRRLDYGTVTLRVSGADGTVLLKNVAHPQEVLDLLRTLASRPQAHMQPVTDRPVEELIRLGENQYAEYKASLMWDYRRNAVNKELYEPVMKNLVGFMNAAGGVLLIGVGDDGEILGIEQDLSTLRKPNTDGFENVFNVAFSNMVGVENRQFVTLAFPTVEEKQLCMITVMPANRPVYLRYQGKEEFYIRAGNASQALSVSKAAEYMQGRFVAA